MIAFSTVLLQPLLVTIVARGAKALPIGLVPKQLRVAFVRRYVINHSCRIGAAGVCADRVEVQPFLACGFPLARIATLTSAGPVGVMALVPGAGGSHLADTQAAMRHNGTADAKVRWAAHVIFAFKARNPARSKSGSRPASMLACR